jgi:hypothetical protein
MLHESTGGDVRFKYTDATTTPLNQEVPAAPNAHVSLSTIDKRIEAARRGATTRIELNHLLSVKWIQRNAAK